MRDTPRFLSAPAREVLAHLLQHERATFAELCALQTALNDNRSDAARKNLPYNLRNLGYVEQVAGTTPRLWQLTSSGKAAAQDMPPAPKQPCASTAPAAGGESAQPTATSRRVAFAGRTVAVPSGPRWVFDLASAAH